jgi:cytidylate kinase
VSNSAVIAIDGPSASGKTTVGKMLARRMNYRFLDTGIMYRALTWAVIKSGTDSTDSRGLVRLTEKLKIDVVFSDVGEPSMTVDHMDTTPYLRRRDVEQQVSVVSRVPGVRNSMVAHQRHIAQGGQIVMVGRDIGTTVLPDAPLKVFLTASISVRAHRRYKELQALGGNVTYENILDDLDRRDKLDSERKVAPLMPASDAHIISTDSHTIDWVAEKILLLAERSLWG